jgi:hypothetical protein
MLKARGDSFNMPVMHDPKVEAYLTALIGWSIRPTAREDVATALRQIDAAALMAYKQGLRLLAMRRYLRLQDGEQVDLHAIWSWSDEQVQASLRAGTALDLMNAAARVQATFARNNPGYTLGVSPPRSLSRQVYFWVTSASARVAGERLLKATSLELDKQVYDLPPHMMRVESFAIWLRRHPVDPEPGNAAPGTSDHGQMRAVDFVVMQGPRVIAGTSRESIPFSWTNSGWAQRLAAATVGTGLRGPLRMPYEPWHWSLD